MTGENKQAIIKDCSNEQSFFVSSCRLAVFETDWRSIGGRLAGDWRAIFRQSVRVNKRSVSGKWELKNIGKKGNRERERERGGGVVIVVVYSIGR